MEVGTQVRINGSPFHGELGIVVDTWLELDKARKLAREEGLRLVEGALVRGDLVPVFLPRFETTLWWWFSPLQLKPLDFGDMIQ